MPCHLIPNEYLSLIPDLYSTENIDNPTVHLRFFHPLTNWQWFIIEYDKRDTLYGLVKGFDTELGYISLSELLSNGVERDKSFIPKPLNRVLKEAGCEFL